MFATEVGGVIAPDVSVAQHDNEKCAACEQMR